tara:strand:+ start:87 stop:248 length:162 start_codon:yes stop_codon:yes gene_type:complete
MKKYKGTDQKLEKLYNSSTIGKVCFPFKKKLIAHHFSSNVKSKLTHNSRRLIN